MINKALVTVTLLLLAIPGYSQEKSAVRSEVTKEVKMTDENGEKKLIVITTSDGKVTEEVFIGERAEEKLAEIQQQHSGEKATNETMDVRMEIVNGKKKLTVTKKSGDKETVEVYEGEEAEEKLKELENNQKEEGVDEKVYIKKKKTTEH